VSDMDKGGVMDKARSALDELLYGVEREEWPRWLAHLPWDVRAYYRKVVEEVRARREGDTEAGVCGISNICGMVSASGRFGEPLACGHPKGHGGKHSWASLPTFVDPSDLEGPSMAERVDRPGLSFWNDELLHVWECPHLLRLFPDAVRCGYLTTGPGHCPYDHGEQVALVEIKALVLCSGCWAPIMRRDSRAPDGRLICSECALQDVGRPSPRDPLGGASRGAAAGPGTNPACPVHP
jgi:hypothetical protein